LPHRLLQADLGVHHPLPDQAGGDEGHRVGVQEDGAQQAFATQLLVHEHRQQEADHQACGNEDQAVHGQVVQAEQPAFVAKQAFVLRQADKVVAGKGA
jgi:hypothetical protein